MTETDGVDPLVADPNLIHDLAQGLIPLVATKFGEASRSVAAASQNATTLSHGSAVTAWRSLAQELQTACANCSEGLFEAADILNQMVDDFVEVDGLNARQIGTPQSELGEFAKKYPERKWVPPVRPDLSVPDTELPKGAY